MPYSYSTPQPTERLLLLFLVVIVLVFLSLRYAMVLNESPVDGGAGVDPWPALV
jgi:hypothetical protein